MKPSGKSFVVSLFYGAGLLVMFAGERLFATGTARGICTGLGAALLAFAFATRLIRRGASQGDVRRCEQLLAVLYGLGLLAILLYFAQSDVMDRLLGKPLAQSLPRGAIVLGALWPTLMLAAVLPTLLVEYSYASMAEAPVVEFGRVWDGLLSGLGLACALVFAFCAVYVGTERDSKWDVSYFRTSKPGDATRKIVRALDEPVQVILFFPPANDVRQEVVEFFSELAKESPRLSVQSFDKDVEVARAKELNVSTNGTVVFARGTHKEQMNIGVKLETARGQLRTLDQDVQKRLLAVAKSKRTLYFTAGHGERSDERALTTDQRSGIAKFKEALRGQNYETRNLGAAEGSGTDVPKDAGAVFIVGPTADFLPEEIAALVRYFDGGGHLMIAVDPESKTDLSPLLKELGVKVVPGTLANDQVYVRHSHQLNDRINIASASFSSHPSVTSLSQLGARAPIILLGASALESPSPKPAGVTVDFTIHAHPMTWNDLNGNFMPDGPAESRKAWDLAAAVKKKAANGKEEDGGRALVIGDSDALTDLVFENAGNAYFAVDGVRWLSGDDSIAGQANSEADIRIEHTRKQDVFWFYSAIFVVPGLILAIGFAVTRRRNSRKGLAPAATPSAEGAR